MATNKTHKISVIICAAGRGERAGFPKNKLLAPLYGAPALFHTLEKFDLPEIDEVVIAAARSDRREIEELARPFGFRVVTGGRTRSESVKNALAEITGDIVLIHDGARPFVTRKLIDDCIDSAVQYGSGVCALPFTDTAVTALNGQIVGRPERESLYAVQTPQGFSAEEIRRAYAQADDRSYTDDSAVYAQFIGPPRLIAGDPDNRKLTYRGDFLHEIPRVTPPDGGELRVGLGVDVHAFGNGDFVTLAGVKINCDGGMVAHSDGDVVLHAVMDALLSAAGLKDIGHYFPDTDPSFKGANSGELLKIVGKTVKDAGYAAVNLSVTIQAERPRLSPHIDKMRAKLSELTGVPAEQIAIAAGTCERLGYVGRGMGIAAYCAALIKKV